MVKKQSDEEPKSKLQEFREAREIDRDDMDTMLTRQHVLYGDAFEEHALAVSRRDMAKNDMERVYSETYLTLRKKSFKDKPSETTLKHMVETDDDYLAAQAEYFKMKKSADRWEAIVISFKDRSYMLREYSNRQVTLNFMDTSGGKTRHEAAGRVAEGIKAEAGKKRTKRTRVDDDD